MDFKNFFHRYFGLGNQRREFKKELRLLIVFTFGFTIAFTWRQTIFDLTSDLIQSALSVENNSSLTILTSFFITIISVAIIYTTSYFLKDADY
jgi:hypothetical protein